MCSPTCQQERLAKPRISFRKLPSDTASPHLTLPCPLSYTSASNRVILVDKPNIPRPLCVPSDELFIARWALIFGITGQHALETHAYRLDVLDRRPALRAEQIETDDAIGVDVRMNGDCT